MKVKELQEKLSKFDPDLGIICYSEDKNLLTGKQGFILFDIFAVGTTEAERCRLDDGTPYLRFGKSDISESIALLEITSDD